MEKDRGSIDMVVGGQYGDEGKGIVTVMLNNALGAGGQNEYSASVRVGGSQAEHRFKLFGEEHRMRVLPSLTVCKDIELLLGAGHIIRKDILFDEVRKYKCQERVYIDSNATVVHSRHRTESKSSSSESRGGYSMGISQALIEKIRRKKHNRDILAMDDFLYTGEVNRRIDEHLDAGNNILMEGTQGALLSLNHGYYPYVTSYDVTPTAMLAQAGIGFKDVRDIYMLFRYNPIRVSGNSGPTGGQEISWDDVKAASRTSIPDGRIIQRGEQNEAIGQDRVFKWSWTDFEKALILGEPTKLILTHTDWAPMNEDISCRVMDMEAYAEEVLGRKVPVAFVRDGDRVHNYMRRK